MLNRLNNSSDRAASTVRDSQKCNIRCRASTHTIVHDALLVMVSALSNQSSRMVTPHPAPVGTFISPSSSLKTPSVKNSCHQEGSWC